MVAANRSLSSSTEKTSRNCLTASAAPCLCSSSRSNLVGRMPVRLPHGIFFGQTFCMRAYAVRFTARFSCRLHSSASPPSGKTGKEADSPFSVPDAVRVSRSSRICIRYSAPASSLQISTAPKKSRISSAMSFSYCVTFVIS